MTPRRKADLTTPEALQARLRRLEERLESAERVVVGLNRGHGPLAEVLAMRHAGRYFRPTPFGTKETKACE